MMMRMLLLALAVAAGPTQQPPHQFDLVCSGSAVTDDSERAFERSDVHLRVDLDKKVWCEEPPPKYAAGVTACAVLNPIADVQPGVIWFEKASPEEDARGIMHWRAVDRQTGAYHYAHQLAGVGTISVVSQCQRAPFSGFPKVETKF